MRTMFKNEEAREEFSKLPQWARVLADEHVKCCHGALLILDSALVMLGHGRLQGGSKDDAIEVSAVTGFKFPEPKVEHNSFWLRREPSETNDRGQRVPATAYTLVWIYELVNKKPDEWHNDFDAYYRSRLDCAIAHTMEFTVRAHDQHVEAGYSSLCIGGRALDHEREEKSDRIAYGSSGGNSCTMHIGALHIARMVETVVKTRERLYILSTIKGFMPKETCRSSGG
jgi:hypothetical protein